MCCWLVCIIWMYPYVAMILSLSSNGDRTSFPLHYFSVADPLLASGQVCDVSGEWTFSQVLLDAAELCASKRHCFFLLFPPTFLLLAGQEPIPKSRHPDSVVWVLFQSSCHFTWRQIESHAPRRPVWSNPSGRHITEQGQRTLPWAGVGAPAPR